MSNELDVNRTDSDTKQYWAVETDPKKFAAHLERKITRFCDHARTSGRLERWKHALLLVNGRDRNGKTSAEVKFGGKQGELVEIRANTMRQLHRSQHVLITGSRPALASRSIASGASATQQMEIGNYISDYYMDKGGADNAAARCAWYAPLCGDAWVDVRYDSFAHSRVNADMSSASPDGDVTYEVLRADQVIRDIDAETIDDIVWVIIHRRRNRWELAEKFPKWRKEILDSKQNDNWTLIDETLLNGTSSQRSKESDYVDTYEFFHAPTLSCPNGRYAMYCNGSIVSIHVEQKTDAEGNVVPQVDEAGNPVLDETGMPVPETYEANPYREIPVYPMMPSDEPMSPMGYGDAWDLMGLQQAIDSCITQAATTQENYGLQTFWIPPQGNTPVRRTKLSAGMAIIESSAPPQALDFVGNGVVNAEKAIEIYRAFQQSLTGLNDAALGDASKSQSGAALAMLHSMSLQYNSHFQRAYVTLLARVMTATIRRLQMFATAERIVEISGKNKQYEVRKFKAEDIATLRGVDAELDSPMLRTAAGRKELADKLLAAKMLTHEQYMEVLATGRTEPIFDLPAANVQSAESENELMMDGAAPPVEHEHHHLIHIGRHAAVINDPNTPPPVREIVKQHIKVHLQKWQEASMMFPAILLATGQDPMPMPPPPPPPPPGPPGPPMPGPNAGPPGMNPGAPPHPGPPNPMPHGEMPMPHNPSLASAGPNMPKEPPAPMPVM